MAQFRETVIMLNRFRLALRTVFLRRRLEQDMQEEMASHLARSTERLMARGLTTEDARKAARREFGNVEYLQEQARDARGSRWIESIIADLRFAIRYFARTPYSTATMIVFLALGIGFNSALFTMINSISMPPAAVTRDKSLVRIRGIDRAGARSPGRELSYPEYRAYAEQTNLFSAVTAWSGTEVLMDVGERQPSVLSGTATYVTDNYFRVLGVNPILGGLPAAPTLEPSPPQLVAVISHALWERHFDRSPDVLGKTVRVNDAAITVVGVTPPRFSGTAMGGSQLRLWLPLSASVVIRGTSTSAFRSYDSTFLGVAARLKPRLEPSQTIPTVQAIAARSAQQTNPPRAPATFSADVVPLLATNHAPPVAGDGGGPGSALPFLLLLLVLLIPCINVSAMLVGLAVARRREIVVRLALGASRRRIVRQLLTESVLLALAAGALGLWIIWILLQAFGARIPDLQIALNWPVLLFTFGLAAAVGIGFGVSPALHATRLAVADVLKDSAGAVASARSRLHSGLVVAQLAFALPLLFALGALIVELISDFERIPAGTYSDRILDLRFGESGSAVLAQQREEMLRRLEQRLASLPGVMGVVPQGYVDGDMQQVAVHPTDRVAGIGYQDRFRIRMQPAPAGYFELLGIPFVRGRDFVAGAREDRGAIVIGGDLARQLWGSDDPTGRRLVNAGSNGASEATAFVVVGVVDETKAGLSGWDQDRRIFVPNLRHTGSILVRTQDRADAMMPLVRSVAHAEAPQLPLRAITTLAAIEARERAVLARAGSAAGAAGVLALLMGAVGLYAIIAFAVGQRTREIGIRTALGADRRQVVNMFLFRGLRLCLAGVLIGLSLGIIVLRLIALEQGETLPDSTSLLGAVIVSVVVGTAILATWIPARRAAAVDPLSALRTE